MPAERHRALIEPVGKPLANPLGFVSIERQGRLNHDRRRHTLRYAHVQARGRAGAERIVHHDRVVAGRVPDLLVDRAGPDADRVFFSGQQPGKLLGFVIRRRHHEQARRPVRFILDVIETDFTNEIEQHLTGHGDAEHADRGCRLVTFLRNQWKLHCLSLLHRVCAANAWICLLD